jgi:hypothetical protein
MQYILTEAEYDALTPVKRLQSRNEALEVAREIIIRLSGYPCGKDYCDGCPISDIGFNYDDSKTERPSREVSRYICIRNRKYSK